MKWISVSIRSHPAATYVRLKPSVDISFTALLYFGATLFIGVAAMNSQTNLLFGLFGLMIGVLLVAGFVSRFSLRRLEVHRAIPEHMIVGEPTVLTYTITNEKRYWPSVAVSLGELDGCEAFTRQPYGYMLHAAAGESISVSVKLQPKRRGVHELNNYQIGTSFPFGFVKRAGTFRQKDTIVVFPPLAQVDPHLLLLCESAENAGARMRPRKGGADEFYGLREYRTGENPRLIHWRRSARTGDLVMREMTQVSPPRLLLVIDNYREAATDITEIERSLAMAASLASLALGRGYPVGLLAFSGDWIHVPPNRGKRHRRELLTAIAVLNTNTNHPAGALLEQAIPLAGAGTSIVLFTPGQNGHATPGRRHGRVVTISTKNPELLRYFSFREGIDFAHEMPLAQESPDFRAAVPELFGRPETEDGHV